MGSYGVGQPFGVVSLLFGAIDFVLRQRLQFVIKLEAKLFALINQLPLGNFQLVLSLDLSSVYDRFWIVSGGEEVCKACLAVFIEFGSLLLYFGVICSPELVVLLGELFELTAVNLQMLQVTVAFGRQDAIWVLLAVDAGFDVLPKVFNGEIHGIFLLVQYGHALPKMIALVLCQLKLILDLIPVFLEGIFLRNFFDHFTGKIEVNYFFYFYFFFNYNLV